MWLKRLKNFMKNKNSEDYVSYTRTNCRLCLSKEIELAVNIGKSPISEKYVKKDNLDKLIPKVPLDLYFCKNCSHVQLLDVVNPDFLWSDFTFKTSLFEIANVFIINMFFYFIKEIT